MSSAMTMAHTGAQMLVSGVAKPEHINSDGVYAFAVAVVELERQRDALIVAVRAARARIHSDVCGRQCSSECVGLSSALVRVEGDA